MTERRPQDFVRNFSIIAHIDHGKSTLADRLMQATNTVSVREFQDQMLDNMDLERERGITIKARAVRMYYRRPEGVYELNLIDTPGHVDFTYEVSRSLAACEGALLVVDAAQSIEAQTVANCDLAVGANLEIVPVLNKVDLPTARPEEVADEIEHILGLPAHDALHVSAKTGLGVAQLLDQIVEKVPAPKGDPDKPLRALIFDAEFNDYRGVVVYVRVFDGRVAVRDRIELAAVGARYEVLEVGHFSPAMTAGKSLECGEVGYLICNIKTLSDVRIGDTVRPQGSQVVPLEGYREPQHVVFCGLFPSSSSDFENLRKALEKLHLNDCSFKFEPESSEALGFGFRCGFLGLLHMEIVQERLERESGLNLVQTAPNVTYEVVERGGKVTLIDNPADLPPEGNIEEMREPVAKVDVIIPAENIGVVMKLCVERYGTYKKTEYLSPERVLLSFEMPLAQIIFDFYDKLKSSTRGYGTMNYHILGYRPAELVKLRILVAGDEVDALSTIVRRDDAERFGRKLLIKLREEIPRHLFEVALQVAIGGKIIARESIAALRKDVTSKCYGGDITRKRKLLEKQKEGKKRMKSVGNVEIPQSAFFAALKIEKD
jgi:GTP-binding protein LepA